MIALAFVVQALRIAIPYLLAAAGGVMSERAGLIALTLEGYMLGGAFGAAVGALTTGSPTVGAIGGMIAGALLALLFAAASMKFRANQVVTGVAINLLVVGLTRFFLRLLYDSSSNSPRLPGFRGATGSGFAALVTNPLVWIGVIAFVIVGWLLARTAFGLRVRAIGEHPEAAASVGVNVERTRYVAVALSGVLAALGGVYLALDQHQFTDQMTAGRGFIALAATIFGRWEPKRVAIACLLFAAAETLQIQLQGTRLIPSQFVEMIPYVLTIVALAGVVGRAVPPAALGREEQA